MRPRPRRRANALAEALERRMLLSLSSSPGAFLTNTVTAGSQRAVSVASDGYAINGTGNFVATWQSSDGSNEGIFARRFNIVGGPDPVDVRVNSFTTNAQLAPAAAMDADGDFVIVWQSLQDGGGYGIYAQRYNVLGQRQGNEFRVNVAAGLDQISPAVAMDVDGNFVVAWASNYDIYARRFTATGLALGNEFIVNSTVVDSQGLPTIAMDADGDFVVAWQSYGQDAATTYGVYARRYNSAGVAQGDDFLVNTFTTSHQYAPSAAMDASGDFVIAWQSFVQDGSSIGVYAKRYNAAGVEQVPPIQALAGTGNEFRVNTTTFGNQGSPAVAMDVSGDFVVAFSGVVNGSYDVFAQAFNAAGVPQGLELAVNSITTATQSFPAVTLNHEGDAVISFQHDGQDGSGYGIYTRRYDESPDTAGPMVTDLLIGGEPVTPGERVVQPPPNLLLDKSSLLLNVTGFLKAGGANGAWTTSNYSLTHNGVAVPIIWADTRLDDYGTGKHEVTLTVSDLWSPLPEGNYVLTMEDAVQDEAGNALDGDRDGLPGGDYVRAFTIAVPGALGPEFRVNTFTTDQQRSPATASDANGNFVVAWDGRGDGDAQGIFAQRYNAAGVPQGAQFRVNTETLNLQTHPAVAMDADGDFVIAWSSFDQLVAGVTDASYGIFAQRYNAAGLPQGAEFHVNQFTTNNQNVPSVAMSAVGDFVIAWESVAQEAPIANSGVYARRYNAAGLPQANEFIVNTYTTGNQKDPRVAIDADGDFVISFGGDGPSSNGEDVFMRRYDKLGAPMALAVRVNTFLIGDQFSSRIAMDADGEYVIAWVSRNQIGASDEIYAQRFNSAGIPLGAEFLVNSITTGRQWFPAIAMDSDGDFTVSWETSNPAGSGSYDIYARRFNAQALPLTDDFPVNSFTSGVQRFSAVAMDGDGDFVIAWQSNGQDGSNEGIFAQRYGMVGPAVTSSSFAFDTWAQLLTFTFSQDVESSLSLSDFVLENLTTGQTIPTNHLVMQYQPFANVVLINYIGTGFPAALPDGDYRATFLDSGVIGPLALPMQQDFVFNFFFLAGDADHDRDVDVNDLGILASNWQQSPRTFSQGDFDYSGTVDVNDLGILASHWQQQLAAVAAPSAAPAGRRALTRVFDQVLNG